RISAGGSGGGVVPVPSWSEKVLWVPIETRVGELAMHTVHMPNGRATGGRRVEVLEAVYASVSAGSRARQTLLYRHFNTPPVRAAIRRDRDVGAEDVGVGRSPARLGCGATGAR